MLNPSQTLWMLDSAALHLSPIIYVIVLSSVRSQFPACLSEALTSGLTHGSPLINAFLPSGILSLSHFVVALDETSFVTTLFAASFYFEAG